MILLIARLKLDALFTFDWNKDRICSSRVLQYHQTGISLTIKFYVCRPWHVHLIQLQIKSFSAVYSFKTSTDITSSNKKTNFWRTSNFLIAKRCLHLLFDDSSSKNKLPFISEAPWHQLMRRADSKILKLTLCHPNVPHNCCVAMA